MTSSSTLFTQPKAAAASPRTEASGSHPARRSDSLSSTVQVSNLHLQFAKLKKCLFGGIAPKQIEIVIQEICMLYDLELYNKNNELEQERKKNEQQDIRMEKVAEYVRQVLETLRSQIQETNHQLNQSSSAYSVLGRKMEEMELLFASSAYQRSHVFKCRRRKKRVVLRKGVSE